MAIFNCYVKLPEGKKTWGLKHEALEKWGMNLHEALDTLGLNHETLCVQYETSEFDHRCFWNYMKLPMKTAGSLAIQNGSGYTLKNWERGSELFNKLYN